MKITIIHGQNHKGSTYHIAHILAEKLQGEIQEVFLPRDFGDYCVGCARCFMEGEEKCPHYERLHTITELIDEADVLILESPVYVYHVTGSMKALLDHYGWRWMVHRPEEKMFQKQAICISTAAGAGMKSTNKDMADSLFWWGVGKIYRYGIAVGAINWQGVADKKKKKIEKDMESLARKVKAKVGKTSPSLKTRMIFKVFSIMQRKGFNEIDANYWKQKGWTMGEKPWK